MRGAGEPRPRAGDFAIWAGIALVSVPLAAGLLFKIRFCILYRKYFEF
ncbi:hypothetical protein AZ21_2334 [Bordetella bronchiseptica B20-10725633]|nr:hypothetical protein AZ21_2334 [Bordetella bronchiseptica B20-10725633]